MFSQSKKKLKANTANLITLTNLSFGGFSALATINGQTKLALFLIFLSALADRYDGVVARKFRIESELGKQLDSLCDLISFGVAPAVLVYQVSMQEAGPLGMFFAVFFIGCGAYRLARFNVTPSGGGFFTGMPIPVAACIVSFFTLFTDALPPGFFMILSCLLSLAMVSSIKMKKI